MPARAGLMTRHEPTMTAPSAAASFVLDMMCAPAPVRTRNRRNPQSPTAAVPRRDRKAMKFNAGGPTRFAKPAAQPAKFALLHINCLSCNGSTRDRSYRLGGVGDGDDVL